MEQVGEFRTETARSAVWAGLSDPAVLERCISGAANMVRTNESEFHAVVSAPIGAQSVLFDTNLQFAEVSPTERCSIGFQAKSGGAGDIDGVVTVGLSDDGSGTRLNYKVDAEVSGELATLDSRLTDQVAGREITDFFTKFEHEMNALMPSDRDAGAVESAALADRSAETYQPSQQGIIWAIMFGVLILAVVLTL